jgi:tellurite resistance protein TehA-like permease
MTNSSSKTPSTGSLVDQFNMLWFIMALGFGGTSVAGYAFLNNTLPRNPPFKGMLYNANINEYTAQMGTLYSYLTAYLKVHMLFFGALHIVALIGCTLLYFGWRKKHPEQYNELYKDTTRNSILIAPPLAYAMAFNVFLVLGYVFVDWMRINLDLLIPYASGFYGLLWLWTMATAIRLQATALSKGFDVNNMHFGWLLIPFSLAMTSVTGAGIAYLAHGGLADTIFFLSLTSFTMALFLLCVKLFSLFKSHYATGMPSKVEFLPSFFVVVPILTLLTISILRYGYYFQHKFPVHLPEALFAFLASSGFALMTWYMALGLFLMRDYFKEYLFNTSYFDESQWGLICPMVAYSVLATFVYKHALAYPAMLAVILIFMALDVIILITMLFKQYLKVKSVKNLLSTSPGIT